jgi:hypothetical protein
MATRSAIDRAADCKPKKSSLYSIAMKKLLPSIYVISLFMAWVFPGFLIDYLRHPSFGKYYTSFIAYYIAFASAFLVGFVLFVLNNSILQWEKYKILIKYLIVITAYTAVCVVFLFSYGCIDKMFHLDYFGGDPEGSWFMLTCPSVVFYAFLGLLFCCIYEYFFKTKKAL